MCVYWLKILLDILAVSVNHSTGEGQCSISAKSSFARLFLWDVKMAKEKIKKNKIRTVGNLAGDMRFSCLVNISFYSSVNC